MFRQINSQKRKPMKKHILSLIITTIIFCFNHQVSAQTCPEVQDKSFLLQGAVDWPCQIYTARDNITLKPGFTLTGRKQSVKFTWTVGSNIYTPELKIGSFEKCSGIYLPGGYDLGNLILSINQLQANLIATLTGTGYIVSAVSNGSNWASLSVEYLPDFTYSGIYTSASISFIPFQNTSFTAKIDDNLWFPVNYLSNTEISDPGSRLLNTSPSISVGSTAGQASVSLTGGATYTIPVFSPLGTAGMQPSVSLVYNSQGGNGIAGYGWSIAGLSAITRLGKTIYHDGAVKGIDFNDDRFALDGQRLIKISGVYGADGTVYYTEVFSGSKVISHGTTGVGPEWFEVFGKDGSIVEYGKIDNARQTSQRSDQATIAWHINKITDPNGNYITFLYNKKPFEINIREIQYTGNSSSNPQITPYNSIKFYYSNRTDKSTAFIAGSLIEQSVLLDHINVVAENQIIKTYKLNYYFKLYSKLNEIIEYGRNNEQYNSTVFGYGDAVIPTVIKEQNWAGFEYREIYNGDFNGDGLSDLFILMQNDPWGDGDKRWEIWLNSGNGSFTCSAGWNGNLTDHNDFTVAVGDYNGDGFSDVYLTEADKDNKVELKGLFSTGSSIVENSANYSQDFLYSRAKVEIESADFNGDGTDELLIFQDFGNSIKARILSVKTIDLTNGQCTYDFLFINNTISSPETKLKEHFLRDFTNDGIPEIALFRDDDTSPFIILKLTTDKTNQFQEIYDFNLPQKGCKIYLGDFNGDGLTDILCWTTYEWHVYLFTGNQFVESGYSIPVVLNGVDPTNTNVSFQISDYNQDGKEDIAYTVITSPNYMLVANLFTLEGNTYVQEQINIKENFSSLGGYVLAKTGYSRSMDYNGDGLADFGIVARGTNSDQKVCTFLYYTNLHPDSKPLKLNKLANGLNQNTKFSYTTLAQSNYTKGSTAPANCRDIQYPFSIVSKVDSDDGIGGVTSISYQYKEAIIHLLGKGFMGFKEIETSSSFSNIINVSRSAIDPLYFYLYPLQTEQYFIDEWMDRKPVSLTDFSNAKILNYESTNKIFLPYQLVVTSKDFISGTKTIAELIIDQWGNATDNKVSYYPSHTSTTPTAYTQTLSSNFTSIYGFASKPQDILVTNKRNDQDPFAKSTHITYDAKGNVLQTIDFYGLPKQVTTDYSNFTNVGLPLTTTISSNGLVPRVNTVECDSKNRFVLKNTDPEEYINTATYDPAFGNKQTATDANGLKSTYSYDGFGAPLKTTNPIGVWANTDFKWYTNTDKPNVLYYSESTSNNGPKIQRFYDKLGRVLYSADENAKGQMVCTKNTYNAKGQLVSVSEPYFAGASPTQFTATSYDSYSRPATVTLPTGVIITYNNPTPLAPGLTSSVTNSATNITTSITMDATDKVVSATDPGGTIVYTYYSHGNPKTITAPDGSVVSMTYDDCGRQASLTDPDAGTITYTYNAYGELVNQTDAKSNEFTMTYDRLGRLLTKTCMNENDNSVITNTYNLHNATNAKGLLSSTNYKNEAIVSYIYDGFGRVIQKTEHTDKDFNYFYTYDTRGRVDEYTYPSGFVTKNTYSATNGSLVSVIDKATGTTIYAPGNTNARGQLTDYINAGGALCTTLQYDIYGLPTFVQTGWAAGGIALQNLETQFDPQTGNLNYRKDKKIQVNGSDLTETFTYDPVHKNRLATWQVTGQPQFTMTYADNNGNILTKSDITSAGNPYIYTDESNQLTKPHAVKSINAPLLIPAEPQQSITYNRFNKIQQLTHTKQGLRLEIKYGPDEQRVKSDFYVNNVLAKTRYFVGGDYEVEKLPDGSERRLHYLPGGGLYVCDKNNVKIGMYYVLTDYQGNWYKVVTETGSLVEQYSFDAWGKRRNATNWSYTGVPTSFIFDRGYTGHEMLDAFGLINMNGRLYDPVIARFLSPDNYVQAPDNSQNFNRYSYCLNNPLLYTDPDGEIAHVIIGAAIGGFINLGIKAIQGKIHNPKDAFVAFGIGAAAGALGAATGGAAFVAAGGGTGGLGGFLAGAAAGAVGYAASSPIQSIGNSMYFGDPMMTPKEYFTGIAIGGALGGATNGAIALMNGRTFWNGTLPHPNPAITRLPFPTQDYKAEIQPNNGRAEIKSISGASSYENPSERLYFIENAKSGIIQNAEGFNVGVRDPNFRPNLIKISGIDPGKLYQAHHVFPVKFGPYFAENGINVNSYGVWWESSSHLANSSSYNNAWSSFIRANPSPSQKDLFMEALKLKKLFGY